MKSKLLELLQEAKNKSNGHCGVLITELIIRNDVKPKFLKEVLLEMYKSKQITVHENVHGKLIKLA